MSGKKNFGNYFWRGGQRIELEEEEEFFTALARDESDLERVRLLSGVREVKSVGNQVFKVRVSPDQRDTAMERFRSDERGGVCHHAYRPKGATNTRYYLTDRIMVKFGVDESQETIESILSEAGTHLLREYPDSPNTFLLQVTRDAGKNPIKVANELAERDEVEYAEPNLMNRFQKFHIPRDDLFSNQWHLRAWEGAQIVEDADVSATEAWELTRGKRDVVVAVIDDAFELTHRDLSGPNKVVHPKDYVDGGMNPLPGPGDYHGTPCAGVAIAEENGEGVVGIAPGCAFMPVRFGVSTASDDLLWTIFDYVGKHADVISCSWGPPPVYAPLPQLLSYKIRELATSGGPRKKGCVIVFAAGNYNAPLNDPNNERFKWFNPDYGLVETNGPILNGSAAHQDVITVAASTSLNRKAAYSNWGKEISVCAPSNNFHPHYGPSVPRPGLGIWTIDNEEYGGGFTPDSRFTGVFGGTSSAAPLVAGIAALMISENPELSASEVKQILEETADKIVDPNPDSVLGLTEGSYDANGHSKWFGFGKVNAARAVQRARVLSEDSTGISNLKIEGVTAEGNLAETGAVQLFKVTLGDKLGVTLEGPEGQDFDVYLKRGSVPTTGDYDARGVTGSANEKVVLQSAEPGEYYILVKSYRGAGNFKVKVEVE